MFLEEFNQELWQGRIDQEDGLDGLRLHQIVQDYSTNQDTEKVIVGFSSEEGVSRNKGRLGAKDAPNFIRKALSNLPVHFDVKQNRISDFGNIVCDQKDLENSRQKQIEVLDRILTKNQLPIVLGGGHETALGNFLALSKHYKKIGIVNIDTHFDLRLPNPKSTSGTPFYEMFLHCQENHQDYHYTVLGIQENGNTQALFKRAEKLNVKTILADEIHYNLNRVIDHLKESIKDFDAIYLSLDMDVFDVAFAPGVSATTINGLTPFQVKYLIKTLLQSNKIKLFDVVELNPTYDQDSQTAKLAAQMVNEILQY